MDCEESCEVEGVYENGGGVVGDRGKKKVNMRVMHDV